MSLAALISAMQAHGYELSDTLYMRMEAGDYLPEDAERFLDAYVTAMHLRHEELDIMVTQWAYDLLRRKINEDAAWRVLGGKLTKLSQA